METNIDGHKFRTAEGRIATVDLGRALGFSEPTEVNKFIPDEEIQKIMRLRTVPASTAASVARWKNRNRLAKRIEEMKKTSLQKTNKSALDGAKPNPHPTERQTNPALQQLHQLVEKHNVLQNLEEGMICFPELARKVCGYKRPDALRHRLEDEGIEIRDNVRFEGAKNVTGVKREAGIDVKGFLKTIDYLDESKGAIGEFIEMKRQFSNELILNPEKLRGQAQPQVTVEPEVNVSPNVHLNTEELAGQIAEGIARELGGYLENGQGQNGHAGNNINLPGAEMTSEEMREEIHSLLDPWKWQDDYNPWTALYNDVEDRRDFHVPVRQYFLREMDTQNDSRLDAAEEMHRDPGYPPALRVLLDSARAIFGE